MICNLTIGATVVELAGGLGRASETSGLQISVEPSFERVAYIGVNEARQYARPGASVSVSFDSSQTFSTLAAAETYILGLPGDLIDQTGATAVIGHEVDQMVVTGTLSPDATGTYTFREIFNGKVSYEKGTIATAGYCGISWNSSTSKWELAILVTVSPLVIQTWTSSSAVATPDAATGWTPVSPATGTPTITPVTLTPSLTIYDAEAIVSAAHQGATVRLSVSLSGRLTSP